MGKHDASTTPEDHLLYVKGLDYGATLKYASDKPPHVPSLPSGSPQQISPIYLYHRNSINPIAQLLVREKVMAQRKALITGGFFSFGYRLTRRERWPGSSYCSPSYIPA